MPPNVQIPQMQGMPFVHDSGFNLLSILIDIAFGFVGGLIIFFGWQTTLTYGSQLAEQLLKTTGYGSQMALYGLATNAAPFVILAPLGGLVIKELSSVRSFKGVLIFVGAVLCGLAIAFVSKDYLAQFITAH